MGARFVACPACARHVREGECVCPFCGAKAPCATPLRRVAGGISRSAMQAAGAAGFVVGLGDCASSSTPLYGIACNDACVYTVPEAGEDAADAGVDAPPDTALDGPADGSDGD